MVGTRHTSPQLPSLTADSGVRPTPSASLRGKYHNKVPEIANQPLNTLLPLLKGDVVHPEPYYITQNVVLKVPDVMPPWYETLKSMERSLRDAWTSNQKFRDNYTDTLIKDFLHAEIAGIVSSTITEQKANHKDEGRILGWIESNIMSEIYDLTKEICWETLWDMSRKLKRKEVDDLEAVYGERKADPGMLSILRENYMRPLTTDIGQSLINYRWELLLYHTNRYMQRGSLMENYAIVKLQEQIITQVAANVLLTEALKYRQAELKAMDEEERFDHSPRKF